jgi:hypothetical protein
MYSLSVVPAGRARIAPIGGFVNAQPSGIHDRPGAPGANDRIEKRCVGRRFAASATAEGTSVVGRDDRAALDLAVVQEVVGVRRIAEREVFDEHRDLAGLGQADDLDELGDGPPEG